MGRAKKMFIQNAIKHPGALHKQLHVSMDKKIPEKKLSKALHSKSPLLRERAQLTENLKEINARKKRS